jgi:hypothetical protein
MLLFPGVALLLLLVPTGAQAAGAKFRVLNAAVSGPVTVQVNGKTKISKLKLGRTSRRIPLAAGRYTFSAKRGKKTVTALSVRLSRNERVTVVFAMKGKKPQLLLLREPRVSSGSILLRAANFASSAGAVDFRLGGLVIGRKVGFGGSTTVRKVAPNFTLSGLVNVTARRSAKKTLTSGDPLVLAKGSVGLFAVVPRGSGSRLVRLPYDIPPPAPLKQPVIKGTQRFGSKVRCVGDAWRPKGAKIIRRWTVDGAVKTSASTPLTLSTASHAGHRIGCAVSATSKGMTTTVAATFALPGVPTPLTAPSVKVPATALVAGSVVSCNTGTWTGAPANFAVRWIRASTGLVLATGRTYTLTLADNGAVNSLGCDVVATNAGGRSKPKASANTVALGIAPTVTIIARPLDITESTTATFDLAIGGGGANTVECNIDKKGFLPCLATPSPSFSFPADPGVNGTPHTFDVRVGNAVATATDTDAWTIVPLKPVVTITSGPPNPTTSPSASFAWTVTGGTATVTCRRDGVATACGNGTLNGFSTAINGVPHTFEVIATNANPGTAASLTARDLYAWNVNPPAPTITINSGLPSNPTTSTSATFGWSVTPAGLTNPVTCKLDTVAVACGPLTGLTTGPGGVSHTFEVATSNITGPATDSYTWTVNPPQPTVTINSGPPSTTTSTSASFNWTIGGGPPASVTCRLNGTIVACVPLSGLATDADGVSYTFQVSASNVSGTATDSWNWTVNPPPPTVSNVAVSPADGATTSGFDLTFNVAGPTTSVTCELDGGGEVPCTSPKSYPDPGPLVLHTVIVRATNAGGAHSGSQTFTYLPIGP